MSRPPPAETSKPPHFPQSPWTDQSRRHQLETHPLRNPRSQIGAIITIQRQRCCGS